MSVLNHFVVQDDVVYIQDSCARFYCCGVLSGRNLMSFVREEFPNWTAADFAKF